MTDNYRKISKILKSKPFVEGAGVRLKRAFGNNEVSLLDPFLLLDDFHSDNPDDYIAGFPSHPHRGIETITYMLQGSVEHQDSIGNRGVIRDGDVQWMTAGSGIIHSEMPQRREGLLQGFQLWVNLPAASKMMKPRYQEIKSENIPEISLAGGVTVKVISGLVDGTSGAVRDIVVDPEFLDVFVPPGTEFSHPVKTDYTVFAYVIAGAGYFQEAAKTPVAAEHLVIFEVGDRVHVTGGDDSVRFLLVSGKPIKEQVAWYGPIVMNTQEELRIAFEEYQNGTFITPMPGDPFVEP
ncbi:MAG: pirin family protein [bacterium]|nr:pirin family protein [bacterium]